MLCIRLIALAQHRLEERLRDRESLERVRGLIHEAIFTLCDDDDVLAMWSMDEPADAAVAGHNDVNAQLGVADQRVEAWFRPFGYSVPTGHLSQEPTNG